jgi:anti-sigma regulatory factor (Ser/Thr protein kinase)
MNIISEHRLRNDPAQTRQLAAWVKDFAHRADLPDAVRDAFDLALEECITNVISYAWNDGQEHWLTLRFLSDPTSACVEIEDDGRAFNPLSKPPVDTTEPLETRPIGGLGIHMVRQLMDSATYRRENGLNVLTLIKGKRPAAAG